MLLPVMHKKSRSPSLHIPTRHHQKSKTCNNDTKKWTYCLEKKINLNYYIAMLSTYEFPVLCDIIEMHHLEKATGFYRSIYGIWLLLFIPFSGTIFVNNLKHFFVSRHICFLILTPILYGSNI